MPLREAWWSEEEAQWRMMGLVRGWGLTVVLPLSYARLGQTGGGGGGEKGSWNKLLGSKIKIG